MKKLSLLTLIFLVLLFATRCTQSSDKKISIGSVAAGVGALVKNTERGASIENGKYLAWHVAGCIDCHSKRDLNKFSAPIVAGTEGMGGERFGPEFGLPGNVYAKNITPAAIGNWTDDELVRAITEGVNKKGDTLFPIMPYLNFSRMSRQDILDIVAYIRTLKPITNEVPARQLFIPIAAAIPPQLPKPALDKNLRPSDPVKLGEYLATAASCSDCHTPRVKGAPDFSRFLAGGNSFETPGFKVTSANITPDHEDGIGTWTEKMFIQKFRINSSDDYVDRNPGKNNSTMPWSMFGKMKEEDLKAIYAYLRTVPPQKGKVAPWE